MEVINVCERDTFFVCILMVSCYSRYCCSCCEASVSLIEHGWARISALYCFNNVVVVGLLQVVVLMNEAFPFDSILCRGVYFFLHWMTR